MTDLRPNVAQAEHWNGPEGDHWSRYHDRYDAMLGPFGAHALEAAAIAAGDAVLDIGCGCGDTTLAAAAMAGPNSSAMGIDLSGPMIDRARQRAERAGVTNATFIEGDAQTHVFEQASIDVGVSRMGVMFFADPVAAFANIARAMRPGARLAFVCWQDATANEWMLIPSTAALAHVPPPDPAVFATVNPFEFADLDRVHQTLADAGFAEVVTDGIHQPLTFGGGGTLEDAVEFFRHGSMGLTLLAGAEPAAVERAIEAVATTFESYLTEDGVRLGAAAWLVTARRR